MVIRSATHAGSWYSANGSRLSKQLDEFLKQAPGTIANSRFLIGPHAGYTYAGKTLAESYKAWDTSKVKRVFILGPSHHVYFENVAYVSGVDEYETPLGNLKVDKEVIKSLTGNSVFKVMDIDTDEDEHSFEMHAPYIYKVTESLPQGSPSIIPIMISSITDPKFSATVAAILSEYMKDEENAFVISSDFCHWGSRFGYTAYTSQGTLDDLKNLRSFSKVSSGLTIYESIEFLDKLAMDVASTGSSRSWRNYIKKTKNTICGQKPIGILLETIELVREEQCLPSHWGKFNWIGYEQSSSVTSPDDSSVSYASAYAIA